MRLRFERAIPEAHRDWFSHQYLELGIPVDKSDGVWFFARDVKVWFKKWVFK